MPDGAARPSDPTARALALLGLLQTHRHWKGSELAAQLRVSERTLRRDVERLRTLGYPVDAGPGVDGGYRLAAGAVLPPLLLDDDEAVALILGVRASAVASIEGIEDTSVRLMTKLDQMLPDRVRRRLESLNRSIDVLASAPDTENIAASVLVVLGQGCRDCEEVRFDYRRRDGEESRRLVQPRQLVSVGRRWYLVAWDVRRDDWRMFRADRIQDPALAGARFRPRELPAEDAASFVAQRLRSMVAAHSATVDVHSGPDAVNTTMRWLDATAEKLPDGRTRLVLSAESLDWLASMIAILAVSFEFEIVDAPDEVAALLARACTRLSSVRRTGG